jgi:hypothetical protein
MFMVPATPVKRLICHIHRQPARRPGWLSRSVPSSHRATGFRGLPPGCAIMVDASDHVDRHPRLNAA